MLFGISGMFCTPVAVAITLTDCSIGFLFPSQYFQTQTIFFFAFSSAIFSWSSYLLGVLYI